MQKKDKTMEIYWLLQDNAIKIIQIIDKAKKEPEYFHMTN